MRDAVHIQSHTWEFHVEDKVVPVLITDLANQGKGSVTCHQLLNRDTTPNNSRTWRMSHA